MRPGKKEQQVENLRLATNIRLQPERKKKPIKTEKKHCIMFL